MGNVRCIEQRLDSVMEIALNQGLVVGLLTLLAVLERVDEGQMAAILGDADSGEVQECARVIGLLSDDAVGIGSGRAWRAPSVVREVLLDRLRAGRLVGSDEVVGNLAAYLVDSGDAASAIRCLMAAEDWGRLLSTLRDNFPALIESELQLAKEALELLPAAVARRDPIMELGRTMFAGLDAGIASVVENSHVGGELVDESGKPVNPPDFLSNQTVWSIILRLAGKFAESSAVSARLVEWVDGVDEDEYESIKLHMPIMRIQWAINHQLGLNMGLAQQELRHALSDGHASGIDFVAKNAAGLLGMNDAMRGETTRAGKWVDVESRYPDPPGWLENRVRIPGLVARVQIALDGMDLERAEAVLAELGMPEDSEELWAAVISAHVAVERARGHDGVALDLVDWARQNYRRWCPPGSFADVALTVMQADLLTAMGRGNEAMTRLSALSRTVPLVRPGMALVHLLGGDARSALAVGDDLSSVAYWPRSFIQVLLIMAAAHASLGDLDSAATSLQRAVAISRKAGAVEPLLSLPRAHREKLVEAGVVDAELAQVWGRFADVDLYPCDLVLVELSERELVVLRLSAAGKGRREVAEHLFVSENTVKTQLRSIYRKLNAANRGEAIKAAHARGLL